MKLPRNIFAVIILISNIYFSQSLLNERIGDFQNYETTQNGILIIAEDGKVSLTIYKSDIVRIRFTKTEFHNDFSYAVIQNPEGSFSSLNENEKNLVLTTDKLKIEIIKYPLQIKIYNIEGNLLSEDYFDYGISWLGNEITCYKKMFSDEKFLGLGEKTGPLNKRGYAYENWNTDIPAYQTYEDPLYKTFPFYISIHNNTMHGIFLDNSSRTKFNFGASTDDEFSSFSVSEGELNYYLIAGNSIPEIIENYTYLTGRMNLPPIWALGYQQCRWSYFPDTEVLNVAKTFREKKIPADVIYLDIHYMDNYKIFTWHPERFSQPQKLLDELKEMGFHITVIVDPGIKIEEGYNAYEEGIANDYFVKYPNGKKYIGSVWPGRCHFPDFTNSEVREWWGSKFTNYVEMGVEGFWNDMNEPSAWGQSIPNLIEFDFEGNKTTLNTARNIYGLEMSRATFEGTKKLMGEKRSLILTRAAYSGIQRYSAVWTGDNFASDEHMLLGVRLLNNLGLAGVPFCGMDIGGFMGEPNKELFLRWLSIGVFTPFFRSHTHLNSKDQEPWSFGEWTEDETRKYINLRYQLLPYIYSTFYEASKSGMPVQRTLAIDEPFDEKVYSGDYDEQFLFGNSILVAPVVSTQMFEKVYLPEGDWYRMSNDTYYEGEQEVLVEAPLWDLPVFIKESAIIPMQGVIQHSLENTNGILYLHIYFGEKENSFIYYEDDGVTYNYEKGDYYKREIKYIPMEKKIILDKVEGKYNSKFNKINLVLHNFQNVDKIKIDGKTIEGTSTKNNLKDFLFDNISEQIEIVY